MVVEAHPKINRALTPGKPGEVWKKTTCHGCVSNTCGMLVLVRNGAVVKAQGDPENPFNRGKLCAKSHSMVFAINDPKRVRRPMKRTNPDKGRGVDPKWVEISYEEAYNTVGQALREQRARDPRRFMAYAIDFATNQYAQFLPSTSWAGASTPYFGAYCGHSVHPQTHVYWGTGHVYPDWSHTRYLILMGSQKGANVQHVPVTAALERANAQQRGMKVVAVDPLSTNSTSKATEWVPIRPGSDGALVLAWLNILANDLRIFDADFLRTYTNTPYLVREDGRYVRDPATKKPMMWDEASGNARVYDDPDLVRPALEGLFNVRLSDGSTVRAQTAFEVFKEQVKEWSAERASEATTIPAETIRRIAREFGEAANIGGSIVIDGEVLPHRPVGIHWYRGTSGHRSGYNTGRLISLLLILLGAIDVPGGTLGEAVYVDPPGIRDRSLINGLRSGLIDRQDGIMWPSGGPVTTRTARHTGRVINRPDWDAEGRPLGLTFNRLWPHFYGGVIAGDTLHPDRHGKMLAPLPPETILCVFTSSLVFSMMDPAEMAKLFQQAKFVCCITSILDEGAELSDVIIPSAHFLERLEPFCNPETNFIGPTMDGEYYCYNIRAPVVETDIPHHWESWFEIAERAGVLADVNEVLNSAMDLRSEYRLDPEQKYGWRQLMERFVQARLGRTLDDVLNEGQGHIKWKKNVKERYPRVYFKNARIPFYAEEYLDMKASLEQIKKEMGMDWWDTQGYTPIPTWMPCYAYDRKDSGEFDLVTVTYKVPFIQASFGVSQPWAAELAELHPYVWKVWMNSETARRKGLSDGDMVRIESQRNGKVVEAQIKVSECVHPEVVGVSSHGGDHWASGFGAARGKGKAAWPQLLYHSHEYMDYMVGQPDHCVAVKVTKAKPS